MFDERGELIAAQRGAPAVLRGLLRGVAEERAHARGSEGWSVVEVVAHLGDAEERLIERVRRMASEEAPVLEGYDQEALAEERGYQRMALAEVVDRFERLRAEHIAYLERLDEAAWARTGRHTEVGVISIQHLVAHMAAHYAVHLAQIARLLSAETAGA